MTWTSGYNFHSLRGARKLSGAGRQARHSVQSHSRCSSGNCHSGDMEARRIQHSFGLFDLGAVHAYRGRATTPANFIETIIAIRPKVLAIDLPNVFCTMAAGHCKNVGRA